MIFNSFSFFIFFITLFACYVFLGHRWQNRLLLVGSYFFYACWDYRFCSLILATTIIDYTAGVILSKQEYHRKTILAIAISLNLLILGFFKYFNFFSESFTALLNTFGLQVSPATLNIILPVGISFYTFQSMSYTIDMYRYKIRSVTSFFDYALYVSFFPQLVAGPIERAQHLIPQILRPRTITLAGIQSGCYYILTGICLKIFMADNIARLINPVFELNTQHTGLQYLLAGYGFAFQIYGDFAGYSYVAKGLGALLGFDIMNNFNLPYFAANPREFWHRWHISLSTWLRDYLYISLGGNRSTLARTVRNLMLTMLLGGLWHGAKITFVLWGVIHGLLLVTYHLFGQLSPKAPHRTSISHRNPIVHSLKIICFFHLIVITWYFFRAESLAHVSAIFHALLFNFHPSGEMELAGKLAFYIFPLVAYQIVQYLSEDSNILLRFYLPFRAGAYVLIFYLIVIFGVNRAQDFIYFQF